MDLDIFKPSTGGETVMVQKSGSVLNPNIYYKWSKEFLEAGKKRLHGDTVREATSTEVVDLKKENDQFKALVAKLSLKNRILKKV